MWTAEKRDWILAMDHLFNEILGEDFLMYVYDKDKGTSVDERTLFALLKYDHDEWEKTYLAKMTSQEKRDSEKGSEEVKSPIPGLTPKQLPFKDTPTAPAANEVFIISDEKDEAEQTTIMMDHDDSAQQPTTQLASAISIATTRAELAALGSLIPPVL